MIKTPLRYPGGKGKMYKQVKQIILGNDLQDKTYVEPFAGGFGIGIKLLSNGEVTKAIINDYDYHIYAIWHCIFYDTNNFINLIRNAEINIEVWRQQKEVYRNYNNYSILEVGFSAFFLNRTNYSGVLKGGPIGGLNQEGSYKIDCRFNRDNLISNIKAISQYRDVIEVYNLDAKDFISKIVGGRKEKLFFNFDPPYVKKGRELYTNFYNENDHRQLAQTIITQCSNVNWIMTYDDSPLIKDIYGEFENVEFTLTYTAGTKKKGKEILITHLL